MRQFWTDKGWYLAFWALAFVAARLWLVGPILEALKKR